MDKDKVRQWAVVLGVIATIALNALANIIPFNGQTTGEISDRFQVYFVPAGYVFSIWGLIYLGLVAFGVYQVLSAQGDNPRLRSTGWLFVGSCVANIAWIFFWHYEIFPLTLVAMLTLLALLIVIYLRLGIGRTQVPAAEKWCVRVPFSIYLGWITVATIANVTDLLEYLNWSGWGVRPEVWAVIMLIAGAIITSLVILTRGDIAYGLVIVWAFIGIAVKQASTPLVANTAWVMTALVALLLVAGFILGRRRKRPPA
ncbi:MAG: tryptophan-rich sensory protein [Chloroflexi bacterium]|nr:tryptophan-rich sensory protein [Chloroflexota bacterium]